MSKLFQVGYLLAAAIVIQILTLGFLASYSLRLLDLRQQEILQDFAQQQSAILARALASDLAEDHRSAVRNALSLVQASHSLKYAGVVDAQGVPVASLGQLPSLSQNLIMGFRYNITVADDLIAIEQPIVRGRRTLGLLQLGYSIEPTTQLIARFGEPMLAIVLVGLLLSVAAVVVAKLGLRQDLRSLGNVLQMLGKGEYGHRAPASRSGIVAGVTNDLNTLAEHLENSQTELRDQYDQLLKEWRRRNALLQGINALVWEVDPETSCFIYVSDKAEELLGYPPAEWLDPDFCQRHVHPDDLDWVQSFLSHSGTAAEGFTHDFRIFKSSGETLWLRMISTVEMREQGPVLVGLLLNVTEEKRNEQRIAYLADHDTLTGLVNRRRFQEKLEEQIAYNRRYHAGGALLFIDLDQFKYVNDSFGHRTGDEYLRQVADHLRSSLRRTDIIGRLGGDEFGIILPNIDAERATTVCTMLLKSLGSQEFIYEGRRTPFSASIGVALFPVHGDNASELLAKADSAMYNAKEQGRNTYRFFKESIDAARMQEKIHWEERIRHALKHNRFQLYFQPIVDNNTGVIRHYESLLRMLGENDAVIGPGAFIEIAERFGMIREIDQWVVQTAIRTQGNSEKVGKPVSLTVNLSGRHFGNREILDLVQETTRQARANPSKIIFEVTETAAVENFTAASQFISLLREMGYRFALDDFGAGFSSFDYLKHIPVDYIKIDGSFVRNLHKDRIDQIFIKAIVEMAEHLGIIAIAEFVENRTILDELRKLKVPLGQGYFFAKPAPRFHEHRRVVIADPDGSA